MKNYIRIVAILLGAIYLVSGISEGAEIEVFANLITSYGSTKLIFFAPIITGLELFLGFGFLLNARTKELAKFSAYFLAILTLVYGFGYYFKNINDCGCFGSLIKINPHVAFLRNIITFFMSVWVWKNSAVEPKPPIVKFLIVCTFGFITFFVNAYELRSLNEIQFHRLAGKSVKNTFLEQYVSPEKATIAVFVFSPTCNHCISVAKSLSKSNMNVIGLYPGVIDSIAVSAFVKEVNPSFQIIPIKIDSLIKYKVNFPTIFMVEKGIVKKVLNNYQSQ
jgi:hypothetical protein